MIEENPCMIQCPTDSTDCWRAYKFEFCKKDYVNAGAQSDPSFWRNKWLVTFDLVNFVNMI